MLCSAVVLCSYADSSFQFCALWTACALPPLSVVPRAWIRSIWIWIFKFQINSSIQFSYFFCVRLCVCPPMGRNEPPDFWFSSNCSPITAELQHAAAACCWLLLVIDSFSLCLCLCLCYTLPAAYQLRESLSYSSLSWRQAVAWFLTLEYRFQSSVTKNSINPIEGVSCPRRQWRPPVRAR